MIINIEKDPRVAGEIRRYHTWKVHHQQSVGEHTWQVMRIMMTIDAGMCTTKLMRYAMLHDVGEMAGDIPWPGKRNDPVLKERHDIAELKIHTAMSGRWGLPMLPTLSPTERNFFKMCENLEMWEFGLQERSMGNRYATVVASRMLVAAMEHYEKMPAEVRAATKRYVALREDQESETELANGSEEIWRQEKMEKKA